MIMKLLILSLLAAGMARTEEPHFICWQVPGVSNTQRYEAGYKDCDKSKSGQTACAMTAFCSHYDETLKTFIRKSKTENVDKLTDKEIYVRIEEKTKFNPQVAPLAPAVEYQKLVASGHFSPSFLICPAKDGSCPDPTTCNGDLYFNNNQTSTPGGSLEDVKPFRVNPGSEGVTK